MCTSAPPSYDRLVRHGGDVGAARSARAHDDGDLGDARGRHLRLVEEDPPEVVAVRKDFVLERQEGSAGVDEVETGKAVLCSHLLSAQVLLDGQREVGAALDRGVVGDDHALPTLDDADAGDDSGCRRLSVVHVPGRQGVQLEECAAGIDEPVDALARGELPAGPVPLGRLVAPSLGDLPRAFAQFGHEPLHPLAPPGELLALALHLRGEDGHRHEPIAGQSGEAPGRGHSALKRYSGVGIRPISSISEGGG